jgi:quinol monooxygenase YgiN
MTNIENHRISTALVAIAALATVLVVSTSAISGHIALAQTNSGIAASSQASAAGSKEIFHVAIFRFAKEHINDAMAAFRALASASRRESGNLGYDIYRGIDDDQEFYIVEHWASPAALAAHERSEAFIHFGQGVLTRYAILHDTVTARAFDVR